MVETDLRAPSPFHDFPFLGICLELGAWDLKFFPIAAASASTCAYSCAMPPRSKRCDFSEPAPRDGGPHFAHERTVADEGENPRQVAELRDGVDEEDGIFLRIEAADEDQAARGIRRRGFDGRIGEVDAIEDAGDAAAVRLL